MNEKMFARLAGQKTPSEQENLVRSPLQGGSSTAPATPAPTAPGSLRTSAAAEMGQTPPSDGTSPLATFGEPCGLKDDMYNDNGQVVIVVDGLRLDVPTFEPSDFYKIEQHLKENRKPVVAALTDIVEQLKNAPPEIKDSLLDRAYADIRKGGKVDDIPRQEVHAWLDTRPGLVYSIWLQLKKRYPSITTDHCQYIMERLSTEKATEMRDETMSKKLTAMVNAPQRQN